MNGILIAVLIVTGLLIYKIISSSRKQEGYKRWKAGNRSNTEDTTDTETTRKGWFSRYFGTSAPITIPWFDEEAVVKCANLLGVEEAALKEILKDIPGHYREFWIGKRKGGYRMISAPDKGDMFYPDRSGAGGKRCPQCALYRRMRRKPEICGKAGGRHESRGCN